MNKNTFIRSQPYQFEGKGEHIKIFEYRPFHKTLPRSSEVLNWISGRFYETDCIYVMFSNYMYLVILKFVLFRMLFEKSTKHTGKKII